MPENIRLTCWDLWGGSGLDVADAFHCSRPKKQLNGLPGKARQPSYAAPQDGA
jgi:hypothetical protein